MAVDVKVPKAGESISEVEIGEWLKTEGDFVAQDEILVILETDKASMELPSPVGGVVTRIHKKSGVMAAVDEIIVTIDETASVATPDPAGPDADPARTDAGPDADPARTDAAPDADPARTDAGPDTGPDVVAAGKSAGSDQEGLASGSVSGTAAPGTSLGKIMPAARRLLAQSAVDPAIVTATGPGGRMLKEDVQAVIRSAGSESPVRAPVRPPSVPPVSGAVPGAQSGGVTGHRVEDIVPMSRMRRRIAERLVEVQREAAILTTFNEVDMSAVIELRTRFKDDYLEKYGVKLGFMSFFVKAAVDALKLFPQMNAYVQGDSIVYHNYFDVGIAVGGGKGLVVPILRNAEHMSFAGIETAIGDFGRRARANKITLDELTGGTFTISNGGVYGSMLSTPIVNPPQSGILGLHAIEKRPVVVDDQIVIRPMMYLALSYDHRIVDGRESVTFLKRIKDAVENPTRILLEI